MEFQMVEDQIIKDLSKFTVQWAGVYKSEDQKWVLRE